MQTHGWGGTGETDIDDENGFIKAGYGVLTWDQRGFGSSGGKVHIDSPQYEGQDVMRLIDLLAERPARRQGGRRRPPDRHERRLVRGRDPVRHRRARQARRRDRARDLVEQPVEHARAARRDQAAVVAACSTAAGAAAAYGEQDGYDFALHRALAESSANGAWSKATHEFFEARGPWNLLEDIEAPTFIIQATTDTLFPPSQAADN